MKLILFARIEEPHREPKLFNEPTLIPIHRELNGFSRMDGVSYAVCFRVSSNDIIEADAAVSEAREMLSGLTFKPHEMTVENLRSKIEVNSLFPGLGPDSGEWVKEVEAQFFSTEILPTVEWKFAREYLKEPPHGILDEQGIRDLVMGPKRDSEFIYVEIRADAYVKEENGKVVDSLWEIAQRLRRKYEDGFPSIRTD